MFAFDITRNHACHVYIGTDIVVVSWQTCYLDVLHLIARRLCSTCSDLTKLANLSESAANLYYIYVYRWATHNRASLIEIQRFKCLQYLLCTSYLSSNRLRTVIVAVSCMCYESSLFTPQNASVFLSLTNCFTLQMPDCAVNNKFYLYSSSSSSLWSQFWSVKYLSATPLSHTNLLMASTNHKT